MDFSRTRASPGCLGGLRRRASGGRSLRLGRGGGLAGPGLGGGAMRRPGRGPGRRGRGCSGRGRRRRRGVAGLGVRRRRGRRIERVLGVGEALAPLTRLASFSVRALASSAGIWARMAAGPAPSSWRRGQAYAVVHQRHPAGGVLGLHRLVDPDQPVGFALLLLVGLGE